MQIFISMLVAYKQNYELHLNWDKQKTRGIRRGASQDTNIFHQDATDECHICIDYLSGVIFYD